MKGPFVPHVLEKQFRFFRCLLAVVPGAFAVSIYLLLSKSSQLHEVLLRTFEGGLIRDVLGLVVFAVLCLLLGTCDYRLSMSTKDLEYSRHANPYLDRLLERFIAIKAVLVAILPLLGLMLGLLAAWRLQSVQDVRTVRELLADPTVGEFARRVLVHASYDRYLFIMTTAAGLVAAVLLILVVVHCFRFQLLRGLLAFNLSLGVCAVLVAWLLPELLAGTANVIGALSVLSLITMGILSLFFILTFMAQNRISLVAIALSIGLVVATYSIPQSAENPTEKKDDSSPPSTGASPGEDPALPAAGKGQVQQAFAQWLKARGFAQGNARRVPVFIFALPGGGIYAASAAATLLATLQDRCADFSRHVFAVSAVSGGAVGASIFSSVLNAMPPAGARRCEGLQPREHAALSDLVRRVILADHLAPVGAFILPDLLRKVPVVLGAAPAANRFDRAQALELSIEKALGELRHENRELAAAAGGRGKYLSHWSSGSSAPALVLNTTWVETGYRVAFAPFPLKHLGDGTLYSFQDELFKSSKVAQDASVLQASVVSARFPGTSPAWQLADLPVKYRVRGSNETRAELRTWNFVDGGYADNSGTLTAYDIFAELRTYIQEMDLSGRIDLRLITLSAEELDRLPDGTRYTDTIAPVSALLNIRNRGLVEVVGKFAARDGEFAKNPDAHSTARSGKRSELLVLRLNKEDFPLTLGWTISEFRNSTIRLQLGEPELCRDNVIAKDSAKDTILGNSCIQRELFSLLRANQP